MDGSIDSKLTQLHLIRVLFIVVLFSSVPLTGLTLFSLLLNGGFLFALIIERVTMYVPMICKLCPLVRMRTGQNFGQISRMSQTTGPTRTSGYAACITKDSFDSNRHVEYESLTIMQSHYNTTYNTDIQSLHPSTGRLSVSDCTNTQDQHVNGIDQALQ